MTLDYIKNQNLKRKCSTSIGRSSSSASSDSSCGGLYSDDLSSLVDSERVLEGPNEVVYKSSKRRWLILAAATVFGICNSFVDNQSVILHTMVELLDVSLETYIQIGLIFSYISVLTVIPSGQLINRMGIRKVLYLATALMALKNLCKALLFNQNIAGWQRMKRYYWILGALIAPNASSIFWCLPLKISESWFPLHERSFSWAILNSAYSLGNSLSSYILPRIIPNARTVEPLYYISIGATIMTSLTTLSFVTKSKPKYPPSERMAKSMNEDKISCWESIKRVFRHRDLLRHLFHNSFYEAIYFAVLNVKQDILIASGHSEIFIGNLMSIESCVVIVMVILLSTFIHKVKNIVVMCKFASFSKSIAFSICNAFLVLPVHEWLIIAVSILYASLASWASPNYTNMSAQLACGNVSVATTSSIQITLCVIYVSVVQIVMMRLIVYTPDGSASGKPDYTRPMIFVSCLLLLNSLIYLLFFKGEPAKKDLVDAQQEAQSIDHQADERQPPTSPPNATDRTNQTNQAPNEAVVIDCCNQ